MTQSDRFIFRLKGQILVFQIKYLNDIKRIFKKYSMHIFGIIAFAATSTLGLIALIKNTDNLALFIPYGILIFTLNLFYLKLMRLSRQDYENKLKKEKEYSQKLLKSQKQFLRYAVHETNTPLAVIMANIELFEMESGKHGALSNIEAATKNISGIYDDLSYLAKKDRVVYPKQHIVLGNFIESRIHFFDIVAQQSNLSFHFNNHYKDFVVSINETKLQRIIDNNITNAIKYTKEGKEIRVSLVKDGRFSLLEFSSESTIIENPEKVFKAYYREGLAQEGLGIGLNLVKNICDEEDIEIELISTIEKTSFRYHFKEFS